MGRRRLPMIPGGGGPSRLQRGAISAELRAPSSLQNTSQTRIARPVDKRRASHPLPLAAFKRASFLRQPRLAHAFDQPVPVFDIARIGVVIDPLSPVRLPRRDRTG